MENKGKIFKNTYIVSFFTFLSRIFGYLRDAAIFIFINNSQGALDSFFVAFRIPNFFRRIFGEGALSVAYIPVLTEYKAQNNNKELKDFVDSSVSIIALVLLLVTLIGVILAPLLIYLIAPGFVNSVNNQMALTTTLLQITFPYMLFICLTALAGSILNTYNKFAIPAFTGVILNVVLIFAAVYGAAFFEEPVLALAVGVFVAGVLQLGFQIYPIYKLGLFPKLKIRPSHPGIKKIKELFLPIIFGSSVTQINIIIDTIIASFLITGSISWLYISDRFVELPLALFGIAIATVILPKLSLLFATKKTKDFNQVVNWAVKMSILVSIPTVIGLIILSKPILISLLNYKEFSLYDVNMTSISLIAFSIGLPAMIGVKILITIFYSMKKTSFPAKVAVIAVFFNVTLNLILVFYLSRINFTGVHAGLSIATSFAAYVNFFLLLREALNQKYIKIEKNTFIFIFKILIASFIMLIVLINFNLDINDWASEKFYVRVINLLSIIFSGIFVFFVSLILFKIKKSEIIPNNI